VNRRDFSSAFLGLCGTARVLLGARGPASSTPPDAPAGDTSPAPPTLGNQYRGYIVDHHSPDPPAITYEHFDPDQWFRLYDESDLDHVWVFCKGHHGEAYYPTKVGHPHPGLKIDFVGAFRDRLRRKGIAFHAYYCIGFDDWAVLNHPEWALLDENGKNRRVQPQDTTHSRGQWHWTCVNTPYRQYVFEQLTEIVKGYAPDGIFLDIVGQPLCYCKYCSELYHRRYHHDIPRGADAERDWRETAEFLYQTTQLGFVKDAIAVVRGLNSNAAITINGGHLNFRKELMDLLDYTFAEPFAGNYLSAMFARGTGKLPEIGPGLVAYAYDPSPDSVFKVESAMIAAQNCRVFMYSETMRQDGTLDPLWFRQMGAGYKDIEAIQPYLKDRDPVPCVAILFSEKTRFNDRLDMASILEGVMEAGASSQFPTDVLPDARLTQENLSRYQALVLPEVSCLSAHEAEVLDQFVSNGGLLIATGVTSTKEADGTARANFALANLMGCDYDGVVETYRHNWWGSYLQRQDAPIWKGLPDASFAVPPPFVAVRPLPGTKVLANHILPATVWKKDTDEDEQAWVNWEPPPPGKTSGHPALTLSNHGKGKTLYASFDLYGMIAGDMQWPLEFHYQILRMYLKHACVRLEVNNRRGMGTTFYQRRGKSLLIVHRVNRTILLANGEVNRLAGGKLILSPAFFRPTSCRQIRPTPQSLKLNKRGDAIEVDLPDLDIHSVIVLEG
jgi:Hypothetical glycosyl hydrolase 6/Beta-galactosidase trimerisation domain